MSENVSIHSLHLLRTYCNCLHVVSVCFVQVLRQLEILRDQSLPAAEEEERLLRTPRPVRIHYSSLQTALGMANVQNVIVESYGMKAPMSAYKWMWNDAIISQHRRNIIVDIGGYVNIPSNANDLILLQVVTQPPRGSFRTYNMLNDIVGQNDFSVGSLAYNTDEPFTYGNTFLCSARLYSPLVHVLKHYGASSLLDLPKTYKQARARLAQIDNFVNDYDRNRIDTTHMVGRMRFEVRVAVIPGHTQQQTLDAARIHARWLLQFVRAVPVPLRVYRWSLEDFRECASEMRLVITGVVQVHLKL